MADMKPERLLLDKTFSFMYFLVLYPKLCHISYWVAYPKTPHERILTGMFLVNSPCLGQQQWIAARNSLPAIVRVDVILPFTSPRWCKWKYNVNPYSKHWSTHVAAQLWLLLVKTPLFNSQNWSSNQGQPHKWSANKSFATSLLMPFLNENNRKYFWDPLGPFGKQKMFDQHDLVRMNRIGRIAHPSPLITV